MRKFLLTLILSATIVGCQRESGSKPLPESNRPRTENVPESTAKLDTKEERISKNLAQLSAEDRKLAEAQKFCAVSSKSRLGSMGVPLKLMLQGQPVFICCDHCRKAAEDNPDKILAQAEKLKHNKS